MSVQCLLCFLRCWDLEAKALLRSSMNQTDMGSQGTLLRLAEHWMTSGLHTDRRAPGPTSGTEKPQPGDGSLRLCSSQSARAKSPHRLCGPCSACITSCVARSADAWFSRPCSLPPHRGQPSQPTRRPGYFITVYVNGVLRSCMRLAWLN